MKKGQKHPLASRSKRLIVNSLCELMKLKDLDMITIKDITDHSELTRRTFYAHFKSKEEVLQFHLLELSNLLIDQILMKDELSHSWITKTYFEFWMSHVELLKSLRSNKQLALIFETFESQISDIRNIFGCEAAANSEVYAYYSSAYFTGVLWNFLDKWIANNTKESPEELVELIKSITVNLSMKFT